MNIEAIIGTIIGVLGIVITIGIAILGNIRHRKVSWQQALKHVEKIALQLKSREWTPDVIVSFPKGGLVVADLLGHHFNNDIDIVSIHTKRVRTENSVSVVIRTPYVNLDAFGQKLKILIIDDIISGGETMKRIYHMLKEISPESDIRTAVLGITKPTYFEPHYHAFKYNRNKDLFLPWGRLTL